MEQKRILRVVVASPSDVQAERDILPTVIDELNRGIAAERNLLLELLRWETDAYPGFHPDGPQGLIDPALKIEDCDILIGIFWKRFGTPTEDAQSGTEHEILHACEARQRNHRPQIMVYFNQKAYTPTSKEEIDQWGKVLKFKESFPKEGLWWQYKGKAQFERLLRNHLTQLIRHEYPPHPLTPSGAGTGQVHVGGEGQAASGRSVGQLTKEYLAGLAGRVGKIYIFGEEEPRALEKVFVELGIVEEYRRPAVHAEFLGMMDAEMRHRRNVLARGEDERQQRDGGERGDKLKRTVKPDELLCGHTKAVITGAPGCGKTTLLRYLAWKTHEARERLPVFLELKTITEDTFKRAQQDLPKLLFDEAVAGTLDLRWAERERFRESFLARLSAGEVAIFLDGLDEVSGADFFTRLCATVSEFVRRTHHNNTLIISTRPYALQVRLEGLKEMEIVPLNQHQIEEFFAHYYGGDPDAQRLLRTLRQRRPLLQLLRVPFLLAVVAQLYRQQQHVVENRLELYRQIVWQLVVQLDREKRLVRRDFRIPDRTGKLKLDFLKYLACERLLVDYMRAEAGGQEVTRLILTGDVILDKARQFWESTGHPAYNPYDLADDVKSTPLLREIGADLYAFTHLTIQEYLVALDLSRRPDCEEVFCRAYFNPSLAEMEVLPMTLGLTSEPDNLYTALERLPESLTYANLRLRARSLAYAPKISRQHLLPLTGRFVEFLAEKHPEDLPYQEAVTRSFEGASGEALKFVTLELAAGMDNEKQEKPSHRITVGGWPARLHTISALGQLGGEAAIDVLIRVLRSNGPTKGVGWRAADALAKIGHERAVPALIETLHHSNEDVHKKIVESLSEVGGERAVAALIECLKSGQPYLDYRAAKGLGKIGGEHAVTALIEALKSPDGKVRSYAAMALGEVGDERAVKVLIEALRDEDVQMSATSALIKIGGARAVDALIKALTDECHAVRQRAAYALGELGAERAEAALIEALEDEEWRVRRGAANALVKVGGAPAVEAVLEALKDEDERARRSTADEQSKISEELGLLQRFDIHPFGGRRPERWSAAETLEPSRKEQAIGLLRKLLKSSSGVVQVKATDLIGQMGGEHASDALADALKSEHMVVRWHAVTMLKRIGGARAVNALSQALEDEVYQIRNEAVYALQNIGNDAAVRVLLAALEDEDSKSAGRAAYVLGKMGEARAGAAMFKAIKSPRGDVRRDAVEALGEVCGEAAVGALIQALRDEDGHVRYGATVALGNIGGDRALEALTEALKSVDISVRIGAADALAKIGDQRAVAPLIQAARDVEGDVRARVVSALGDIGGEWIVGALVEALHDKYDTATRWRAAEALLKLNDEALAQGLLKSFWHPHHSVRRKAAQVVAYYNHDRQVLEELLLLATTDHAVEVRNVADAARHQFEHKLRYIR
jgi:HEAT repeat protein